MQRPPASWTSTRWPPWASACSTAAPPPSTRSRRSTTRRCSCRRARCTCCWAPTGAARRELRERGARTVAEQKRSEKRGISHALASFPVLYLLSPNTAIRSASRPQSTLLRVCAGQVRPSAGRLRVLAPRGYVAQNPDHQVRVKWSGAQVCSPVVSLSLRLPLGRGGAGVSLARSSGLVSPRRREAGGVCCRVRDSARLALRERGAFLTPPPLCTRPYPPAPTQVVMPSVGGDIAFSLSRSGLQQEEIVRKASLHCAAHSRRFSLMRCDAKCCACGG